MMSGQNRFVSGGLRQFSVPWSPYGAVATWYLWRSLDAIGVEPRL
jgi:3-methyladenine DNA glycosylase/8-oxoguanine DNA glycosylase